MRDALRRQQARRFQRDGRALEAVDVAEEGEPVAAEISPRRSWLDGGKAVRDNGDPVGREPGGDEAVSEEPARGNKLVDLVERVSDMQCPQLEVGQAALGKAGAAGIGPGGVDTGRRRA